MVQIKHAPFDGLGYLDKEQDLVERDTARKACGFAASHREHLFHPAPLAAQSALKSLKAPSDHSVTPWRFAGAQRNYAILRGRRRGRTRTRCHRGGIILLEGGRGPPFIAPRSHCLNWRLPGGVLMNGEVSAANIL